MVLGYGIGVNGIKNGEIRIAEIIELLPVLAVLGDDGAAVVSTQPTGIQRQVISPKLLK